MSAARLAPRLPLWAVCAAVIGGCSTPDVSSELAALDTSVSDTAVELRAALAPHLEAERQAAVERAIETGEAVYSLTEPCNRIGLDPVSVSPLACAPEFIAARPGPFASAERKLVTLEHYVSALVRLASAVDEAELSGAVAELSVSFSETAAATAAPGLIDTADRFASRQETLGSTLGYWARQRQYRVLRRTTARNDAAVQRLLEEILATVDAVPNRRLLDAFARLTDASERMALAQRSGSSAQYRAAVRVFEAQAAAWRSAAQGSIDARLHGIAATHAALTRRLAQRAGPEEIEALLVQISALASLTRPEEG